jgi:hypothetical protein
MKAFLGPILAMLAAVPAGAQEVHADAFGYVRVGYGSVLGEGGAADPVIGFGGRVEMDRFGVDVSLLNVSPSSRGVGISPGGTAASLLKVEALYFLRPKANASAYVGGGLSWGTVSGWYSSTPNTASSSSSSTSDSSWGGSGLQGELTAGYELPRVSELRLFVQTDATLPFYRTVGRSYVYSNGGSTTVVIGRRYNPSIALSVGVGWQRHRR